MRCEICLQNPHHPDCPHAPEPPKYGKCKHCGADIYENDEYYEIEDLKYCAECVRGSLKIAGED